LVARHENEIGATTDVSKHSEFLARKTRKDIDGRSVEGWFAEDFTLAELKTLRARERLPKLRGTRYDGDFEIPTLSEIIDLVAAKSASEGRSIGLIPEIKHGSYFRQHGLPIEDRLLEELAVHAYTRQAPIIIQSFEASSLRYLRGRLGHAHRNISLLQLLGAPKGRPADQRTSASGSTYADMMTPEGLRQIASYAQSIGPTLHAVIPWDGHRRLGQPAPLVSDAHAAGLKVFPYTFRPENRFRAAQFKQAAGPDVENEVGSVAEIRAYLDAGIDGFFVDDPALGRKAVDGR
jgi:glycerophosphoryl diester phosphodiesterase